MGRPDFIMPEVCSARIPRQDYTTREDRKVLRDTRRGSTLVDTRNDTSDETRAGGPSVAGAGHGYQWAGGDRKKKREGGRSRLWSRKKGRGGGVHGHGPAGWCGQTTSVLTGAPADHAAGNRRASDLSGLVVGGAR